MKNGEDVRWTRWNRTRCEWSEALTMNSVLTLERGEHTVLGRLEGVTKCQDLGKAIQWADVSLVGPAERASSDQDKVADTASAPE